MNAFTRISLSFACIGGSYGYSYNICTSCKANKSIEEMLKNGASGLILGTACGAFWPVTLGYVIGSKFANNPKP